MMRAFGMLFNRATALSLALVAATAGCSLLGPESAALRVRNTGTVPLQSLTVHFPDASVDFGDVAPGATTDYRNVPGGVYGYGAFTFTHNGQRINQPVIDWVGESPKDGREFTYNLYINQLPEGPYIVTANVTRDR